MSRPKKLTIEQGRLIYALQATISECEAEIGQTLAKAGITPWSAQRYLRLVWAAKGEIGGLWKRTDLSNAPRRSTSARRGRVGVRP